MRFGQSALPSALLCLGVAGTVAGLAGWGWMLLRPFPAPAPAGPAGAVPGDVRGAARAMAHWFEPAAATLDVRANGLVHGAGRDVAVLSVNGGAEQAYVVGESLGPSAKLQAIEADTVVIDHAGTLVRVAVPSLPALPEDAMQRAGTAPR